MKTRNKGKVHPFTSSSSQSQQNRDTMRILNLLPAAIFSLVSVLSPGDSEVLAYMMRRSFESFTPAEEKKNSSKKKSFEGHGHKSPVLFDCDCFYCYTSFWFRWDSSPNRELIHQAIEAFEEHLGNVEKLKTNGGSGRNRRREKTVRQKTETAVGEDCGDSVPNFPSDGVPENQEILVDVLPDNDVEAEETEAESELPPVEGVGVATAAVRGHKGLARKVLPDVIGIFHSRLWGLWNPNM